jgi:3-dehydroquinate synthase
LDEFREHLGGELTVLLLEDLGRGVDVHEMDEVGWGRCIDVLRERWERVPDEAGAVVGV